MIFTVEYDIINGRQKDAYPGVRVWRRLVARYLGVVEAASSNLVTRTMRSVLIGSENPVTDTPHFLFAKILYRDLCRGVADCYAFSCFHDDVSLRDILAVWNFKGPDAVIVDDNPLIGDTVLIFRMVHVDMVNQLGRQRDGF